MTPIEIINNRMHNKTEEEIRKEIDLHTLALQSVEGIGSVLGRKLIEQFGSAKEVFLASKDSLLEVEGVGHKLAGNLKSRRSFETAYSEIAKAEKSYIKITSYFNSDYPEWLRHCDDAPLVLFYKGDLDFGERRILSVVGTRKMTSYGASFLKRFFRDLEPYDPVIVSGLAYGVDIHAHRLALEHGLKTIGVLAHGLDRIYPRAHYAEGLQIINEGALITEFCMGTPPERENFVKRNRIIAGMSEATIIIESACKGGSLITAELASSYHRDVFALPGRSSDSLSFGCNELIKSNRAGMITEAHDLNRFLNWTKVRESQKGKKTPGVQLNSTEKKILQVLDKEGMMSVDAIVQISRVPIQEVQAMLLRLELNGRIRELPSKNYEIM